MFICDIVFWFRGDDMNPRKIDEIIIHCSGSDYPEDDGILASFRLHTVNNLVPWRGSTIQGFGWNDIGYHYFIDKSGAMHPGRGLHDIGAHCKGTIYHSIGICLSGEKEFSYHIFHIYIFHIRDGSNHI